MNRNQELDALSDSLQSLKRRLAIRLTAIFLIALLIITASVLFLVLFTSRETWLLFGSGILFLSILVIWLTGRCLNQIIDLLENKLQARIANIETAAVPQTAETPVASGAKPSTRQGHLAKEKEGPTAEVINIKRTEAEFEELKDKFRRLSSVNYEGIIVHNKINILDANETLTTMFGYSSSELRRMSVVDLSAPESQSTVLRNTLIKYEHPYKAIGVRKDKSTLPIEIFSRLIAHNGDTIRVMALREITELGQAEIMRELQKAKEELEIRVQDSTTELRNANERLRLELGERKRIENEMIQRNRELTILQSAGIAITSSLDLHFVLNTVTQEMVKLLDVESCVISEYNQTDNTITTMAKYDSKGGWAPESVTKVRYLANYPVTKEILEEQITEQMTISQAHVDPAEAAYMQQANIKTRMMLPMIFQRRVVGLVELEDSRVERAFSVQEISLAKLLANQAASAIQNARLYEQAQQEIIERKQAEAALEQERALLAERVEERTAELSRANAELARAARLKDEFLAGMSHELRTPLNAILGSAEILQTEVFGVLTDKQRKYAHNVDESGRHLLSLINDILDLSKIEAGKMTLDIGPVSVKSVCQASLQMIKQLAHNKRLKVSQTVDDEITFLLADERRLKQILVNLLSNAVKFTPEGGEIGLEVSGDMAQEVIKFTVWDTGIGISDEDLARLFQPFTQLDSRLSREYAGTGLGLSLVSRMTEMHGGGVSLESEVGRGSRFTVMLPWRQTEPATQKSKGITQTSSPIPRRATAYKPLILLADDNEDNISTTFDYLSACRYQVIVARNGKEALERASEKKPDLILMDVQMPEMDGLEATRRLRADPVLSQIPVVAVTALAMSGDRERCLAAGANEYLNKPVSLQGLVGVIETQLNRTLIKDKANP